MERQAHGLAITRVRSRVSKPFSCPRSTAVVCRKVFKKKVAPMVAAVVPITRSREETLVWMSSRMKLK